MLPPRRRPQLREILPVRTIEISTPRCSRPFVPLTRSVTPSTLKRMMARYSAFLGRRVEVHYRAGDIVLPATGRLVADSGRSIFLEERSELHGQSTHFRWEVPYQCIV